MRDLYKENEYCMEFSKEEIIENIIIPAKDYPNVNIDSDIYPEKNKDVKYLNSDEPVVSFDGPHDGFDLKFFIHFYKHLTAVYILDEEFMFIDDNVKENMTSSDTHGNIIYEGTLRDKTHKEILTIIFDLFKILWGAKKITKKATEVSQKGWYTQYNYEISIYNDFQIKNEVQFENILFRVDMK